SQRIISILGRLRSSLCVLCRSSSSGVVQVAGSISARRSIRHVARLVGRGLSDGRGRDMIEAEWLQCTEPATMLKFLRGTVQTLYPGSASGPWSSKFAGQACRQEGKVYSASLRSSSPQVMNRYVGDQKYLIAVSSKSTAPRTAPRRICSWWLL